MSFTAWARNVQLISLGKIILSILGYFVGLILTNVSLLLALNYAKQYAQQTFGNYWMLLLYYSPLPFAIVFAFLGLSVAYTVGFVLLVGVSWLLARLLQKRVDSPAVRNTVINLTGIGGIILLGLLVFGTSTYAWLGVTEAVSSAFESALATAAAPGPTPLPMPTPSASHRFLPQKEIRYWSTVPEFSPDGRLLAAVYREWGGGQEKLCLWDTTTWITAEFSLDTEQNSMIRFSPDGDSGLLVAGGDQGVRVWNVKTRQQVARIAIERTLNDLTFSPDGKLLATSQYASQAGGRWETVLWDTASWQSVGEPIIEPNQLQSLAFNPDGQTLMSVDDESILTFWNVGPHRAIGASLNVAGEGKSDPSRRQCWFTPDGKELFYYSGADNTLYIWELGAQPVSRQVVPDIFESTTARMAFNPRRRLVAWNQSAGITVVDLKTQQRRVIDLAGRDHGFSFSPDGQLLAATSITSSSSDGPATGIYIFDVGTP